MADRLDTSNLIQVRFHGNATEYFGIWIVNVLLSIITLTIYSAWAKVRNQKYFLGNTTIDERAFAYHATGLQILIGRIVVISFTIAASVIAQMSLFSSFVVTIVFLVVTPWLINRGLAFRAAMTSWSNIRFRFEGDYWHAMLVFLVYPFLSAFTLFIAYPYAQRAKSRYTIGRHNLGEHDFAFDSPIRPFYFALLMAAICALIGAFFAYLVINGLLVAVFITGVVGPVTILFGVLGMIALMSTGTVYAAFTRNAIYAGMILEFGHKFHSTISPVRLVMIVLTNTVAVILSVGLMLPWARVRLAKYLCEHTWIEPNGSLDEFVADLQQSPTAVGDAFMDIESIDVGIGV